MTYYDNQSYDNFMLPNDLWLENTGHRTVSSLSGARHESVRPRDAGRAECGRMQIMEFCISPNTLVASARPASWGLTLSCLASESEPTAWGQWGLVFSSQRSFGDIKLIIRCHTKPFRVDLEHKDAVKLPCRIWQKKRTYLQFQDKFRHRFS